MGLTVYFDTYAFCELIKGNDNYEKFKQGYSVVTTRLNLMELFYGLLLNLGENAANTFYDLFLVSSVEIDDDTIKNAMKFRVLNKQKRFSYIDCLGYIIALRRGVPFVTGDRQFEDMPNVEFLK